MAVSLEAHSTIDVNVSAVATISSSALTITSGNLLVALLHFAATAVPPGLTVTWNSSTNLTQVPGASVTDSSDGTNASATVMYYLLNPTAGNKPLSATWSTAASQAVIYGLSFTGANQTGGVITFPNVNTGIGALSPATVTMATASGVNDATVAAFSTKGNSNTPSNTSLYADNGGAVIGVAACYSVPGVASAMSAVIASGTPVWSAVGIEIAPPSAVVALSRRKIIRAVRGFNR